MNQENLSNQAIKAALEGNWNEAVEFNLLILKDDSADIDALLRLAKAYEELGKTNLAQKTYQRAIRVDRFNPIAKRNLARLQNRRKKKIKAKKTPSAIKSDLFLEEPGKTKTVSLIKLASTDVLLQLDPAEEVKLSVGQRSISVRNKQNRYLGRLPDDLSQRLIRLAKRGNQYLALVKAVDEKMVQVFIKEIKRSKKNADIPSFPPPEEQYHAFLPPEAISQEG